MNKERAEKFIKYLESVPPEQYDQNDWGTRNECGTAGCFAFHAAMCFPELMDITWTEHGHAVVNWKETYLGPMNAVKMLLQIDVETTRALTDLTKQSGIETPQDAIKKLRGIMGR